MRRSSFLAVTAVTEVAAGVGLLVVPAMALRILLGVTPAADAELISRIAGAALIAIGVACWTARSDSPTAASRGLLVGILIYDACAAALLAYSGSVLGMAGIALWPGVCLHAAMTLWCLACLR